VHNDAGPPPLCAPDLSRFCLWQLALIENLKAGWLQVVSAQEPLPEAP
jgi:hypothetical protein